MSGEKKITFEDYKELADRHPYDGPPATLFVDSNVINEVFTFVDMRRAIDSVVLSGGLIANAEQLRLFARGSLWLAMALDQTATVSMTLGFEPYTFARLNAVPGTWAGDWVTAWLHLVHEHVCPGWVVVSLNAKAGGRAANDTLIADECASRGLPLVTRDRGLVRKAQARGVLVSAPEEKARDILPLADARDRFFARFVEHSLQYAIEVADKRPSTWNARFKTTCRGLEHVRELYEYIWADDPSGELAFDVPAPCPF